MIRMSADAIKLLKPKVFDKSKWMQLPRDVVIGLDVIGQIPSVCEDLKLGKSALLISGKSTMRLAGDTIREILNPKTKPSDFVRPGHLYPLVAKEGGVLRRAGHTECTVDLARMAGLTPAGVLSEILDERGERASRDDLSVLARKHRLRIGSTTSTVGAGELVGAAVGESTPLTAVTGTLPMSPVILPRDARIQVPLVALG